jgi:DNA repair protein RadC
MKFAVRDDQGFYAALPKDLSNLFKVIFPRMGEEKVSKVVEAIEGRSNGLSPSAVSLTREDLPFLGESEATKVLAIIQLSGKIALPKVRYGKIIDNPTKSYAVFQDLLAGRFSEAFAVVYLNAKNEILDKEVVSIGCWTETMVPVPEILRKALVKGASRIMVAHNHPSQSLEPSSEDIKVTKLLAKAAVAIGISLLDHLICSDDKFLSLRQQESVLPWPTLEND